MAGARWKFTLRTGVVSVFLLATTLAAALAIGVQYYFNYQQNLNSTKLSYQSSAEHTAHYLESLDSNTSTLVHALSRLPQLLGEQGQPNSDTVRLFAEMLSLNPDIYSLYLGFADGGLFELVNLDANEQGRQQLNAEPQARWVLNRSQPGLEQRQYLDAQLQLLREHSLSSDFDPRTRPWYQQAQPERVHKTAPYLFDTLNAPGQTYSLALPEHGAVLAADITLEQLSGYLRNLADHQRNEFYLYHYDGTLTASNHPPMPSLPQNVRPLSLTPQEQALVKQHSPLRVSNELDWAPVDFAIAGQPMGYAIDMLTQVSTLTGLEFEFINGHSWSTLLSLFRDDHLDLLQPVWATPVHEAHGVFSDPFIELPFALASHQEQPLEQLEQLQGFTLAIGENWSIIPWLQQHYPDIALLEVPSTLDAMRAVANGQAQAALDNRIVLQFIQRHYFLDALQIGPPNPGTSSEQGQLHLLLRPQHAELLPLINRALANIREHSRQQLQQRWLDNPASLSRFTHTVPYAALLQLPEQGDTQLATFKADGHRYYRYARPLADGDMLFAAVINHRELSAPAREQARWAAWITALCILLLLPLAGLFARPITQPIRRLQQQSEKVKARQYGSIQRVHSRIVEAEQLAASLYAMAQSIGDHEQRQAALMESFIALIAQAIDDKSPYTGAHCARVPELGLMLAEAASQSDQGIFADFSLADEDKQREFRLAAWLHDCGKITTPEHIVDKGAKLECIYNRIHEIRTRFEILWRDAEIASLKAAQAAPEQAHALQQTLAQRQQELRHQFTFVARCNVGGETLSNADQQQLRRIGAQRWQRHFDDRLGLSPLDQRRLGTQQQNLPVSETLLSDKPEHLFAHQQKPEYPPHLGIHMTVPEYRANLGELYNLQVERGTLTAEDRFTINEHIINTIRMLDNLPFPPELAKVPHYASTHHEQLNGQGYPRRLQEEDLEVPDRILAVADVFEALTAADRPYKDAKTLSQSLSIMANMVAEKHLDAEVFNLLLRSGIYLHYAERFLSAEQIDAVDIEQYLTHPAPQ